MGTGAYIDNRDGLLLPLRQSSLGSDMVTRQAEGLQSFISASVKIEARRVVNVGGSIPRVHGPTWDT